MKTITSIQLIDDLGEEVYQKAKDDLKRRIEGGFGKQLATFGQYPLYQFGSKGSGYYCLWSETDATVVYLVRYQAMKKEIAPGINVVMGCQVMTYRDEIGTYRGASKRIFFEYLLPQFDTMVSDNQQTRSGRQFWENIIEASFEKGLFVYMLDGRRAEEPQLIRFRTSKDFRANIHNAWGYGEIDQEILLIVSKVELGGH